MLRARHPDGVPLHAHEHDRGTTGRLPDRLEVEVLRWGEGRRWLEIRARDGTRGWITARYVADASTVPLAPRAPSPWDSPGACAAAGAFERPAGRARLASWNLRWFPDGSSHGPSDRPTDIDWMACAIASLGADAVAVQEVMLHARGRAAMDRLLGRLSERTGGRWEARFDRCRRDGRQHVGWLVDTARVRIEGVEQLDAVNPIGGCAHHLRPGLAIDLRWSGGLDLRAVVVHLDSGVEERDHDNRRASLRTLAAAAPSSGDDDFVVLGDLNTMGCRTCPTEAAEELAWLDGALSAARPPLRRLRGAVECTEYYRRHGSLLDHALVTAAMRELLPDAQVEVAGACARFECELPRGRDVPALERLSDHCPIVIELVDRDLD